MVRLTGSRLRLTQGFATMFIYNNYLEFIMHSIRLPIFFFLGAMVFSAVSCSGSIADPTPLNDAEILQKALDASPQSVLTLTFGQKERTPFSAAFAPFDGDASRFADKVPPMKFGNESNRKFLANAAFMFDTLRSDYPGYGYFGGDARWDTAFGEIAEILSSGTEEMTKSNFGTCLSGVLEFVKDRHFTFTGRAWLDLVPWMATELPCIPSSDGSWLVYPGKDKGAKPCILEKTPENEWFVSHLKPGLAEDGSIAWFAVLPALTYEKDTDYSVSLRTMAFPRTLTTKSIAFRKLARAKSSPAYSFEEKEGSGIFHYPECIEYESLDAKFLETATAMRKYPAVIFDLRGNVGGDSSAGSEWFSNYLNLGNDHARGSAFAWDKEFGDPATELFPDIDDRLARLARKESTWLCPKPEHPALKLVLIDGEVASSGEMFANEVVSITRSLAIGANTGGYGLIGNMKEAYVPNGNFGFSYGTRFFYDFDQFSQEYTGMEPTLYCIPFEAVERSLRFIGHYGVELINAALDSAMQKNSAAYETK